MLLCETKKEYNFQAIWPQKNQRKKNWLEILIKQCMIYKTINIYA